MTYELRTTAGGELIERADENTPLEFICGQGQTIEYFEMNLLGKNVGDTFDFHIPAKQAYGEVNSDMVVELPRDIFNELSEEELQPGGTLPMRDSMGRHLQGVIEAVTPETVTMDFNHPMAGKDLFFTGTVLAVRDATDEELEALQKSHCGGGCSGCGDGGGDCSGCGE